MKTSVKNIRFLALIAGLILLTVSGYGQDQKKLSRQEKNEIRKAVMEANFHVIDTILMMRQFVIEADFLENQYGDKVPVSPTINFIMVNASEGVIQTGSNFRKGYNGVGGITAEGNVGKMEVTKTPKSLSYSVKFNILTNLGAYDIFMYVYSDFHTRAIISGTTAGKLIYTGRLEPLARSKVYKGQRTP